MDEQQRAQATSQLYLSFSYTDAVEGSLTFNMGLVGFDAGTVRVYPCVTSFGSLRRYLGGLGSSGASVDLDALSYITPSTSTVQYQIYRIFQTTTIRETKVQVFQWNADGGTAEEIWVGYFGGILNYYYRRAT